MFRARTPGTRRGSGAALALTVSSLFFVTGPGHSSFGDGYVVFLTARSILDRGTLAVAPMPDTGDVIRTGVDGRSWGKFGPGLAFAHVPVLFVSRLLPESVQPVVGDASKEAIRRDEFWAQATNALLMGWVVALIFRFGIGLGYAGTTAAAVALAAAFASPLWLYARIDGTEALQALGLLGAAYLLTRPSGGAGPAAGAGAALGVAVLAKAVDVLVTPLFALVCLSEPAKRGKRLFAFLVPLVLCAALFAALNAGRFGNPLETGYGSLSRKFATPWLEGASLLLFSPAFGLIFFWPAFPLALRGFATFVRRHPREGLAALGLFAALLALYSGWWAIFGMSWGPRYLVPAIPLVALFLLPVFADRRLPVRLLAAVLVVAGIGVQAVAVASSYWHQVLLVQRSVRTSAPGERFVAPELAPLRIGAWFLRATILERRSGPERARAHLAAPPWDERFPVRDRGRQADELLPVLGLDLWAVPERWRMPYRSFPRGPVGSEPIPSNGLLALLVAIVAAVSGATFAFRMRASPPVSAR